MKPSAFEYHRPPSLDAALRLLADFGDEARLLAGGQSLVPMMNLRLANPKVLIDLGRIASMSGIVVDKKVIRIGAMTRQKDLLTSEIIRGHAPLIAVATNYIGHVQTRSRGTIGGSLANGDAAAELSLVMVTIDAKLRLESVRGSRLVAARDFFLDAMTTVLAEDEILTEILVPVSEPDARVAFRQIARRHGDFAITSAAIHCSPAQQVSIGVGGLGPVPFYCFKLSRYLSEGKYEQLRIAEIVDEEIERPPAISDLHASADYRKRLARTLVMECIQEALTP